MDVNDGPSVAELLATVVTIELILQREDRGEAPNIKLERLVRGPVLRVIYPPTDNDSLIISGATSKEMGGMHGDDATSGACTLCGVETDSCR